MSYTTRCPACGTTFRVVPDQLKISDGWVRCGHCADVFDATLYLQEWTPPPAPPPVEPVPPSQPTPPVAVVLSEQAPESAPVAEPPPVRVPPDAAPEVAALGVVGSGAEPSPVPAPEPAPVAKFDAAALADGDVPSADVPTVQQPAEPDTVLDDAVAEPPAPSVVASVPVDSRPAVAEQNADAAWPGEPDATPAAAPGWETEALQMASLQISATGHVPDKPSDETLLEPPSSLHLPTPSATTAAEEGASDFHAELTRFAEAAGRITSAPAVAPASDVATTPPDVAAPDDAVPANEASEPGFVRQARRQAFWRSPAVRAVLAVLVLLLAGLQVIQWALYERATLAASHPELAPLLTQLCAPLGCEIGPVRRIDAVVIDSSTLVRRLGNFYAFDVVIKNTADIPVAVPALELSLTDTRDSVIARRIFLPSELPGAPSLLPAQGSLPLSLRLSITDVGAVPMAGYRALVFYP